MAKFVMLTDGDGAVLAVNMDAVVCMQRDDDQTKPGTRLTTVLSNEPMRVVWVKESIDDILTLAP